MSDALRALAVLGLVAGNAFFVIGEYAVVTARRSVLAPRAEAGSARAAAALRLMDDPVRVISTVQVGITAIGILTGAIGEPLVRDLLGEGLPDWAGFVIAFAIVTYVTVVLGELVPKALTLDRADALAALVARPIEALTVAFAPLVALFEGSARVVLRPFGVRRVVAGDTIATPEELRAAVDEAERAGVIPRAQEELLHNVFEFASREARQVMTPAPDVRWLDAGLSPADALGEALDAPYTRLPVAEGTLDRVVGVVHLRELAAAARRTEPATIAPLARALYVVPETKDVGVLLRELRQRREQMALVVDEYGRTAGVITVEDLLEEIVGDIEDEYDLPDATVRWLDDRTVEIAGSMPIDELNELLSLELPQEGTHTVAGLVFEALGRRPVPGDEVAVAGLPMRVEETDEARITRLRVELPTR